MFIAPGDVAGAHDVGGHVDAMGHEQHSDDSITDEEDEEHGHEHAFEDEAALLEDELHMMEQEFHAQPQEVGARRGCVGLLLCEWDR